MDLSALGSGQKNAQRAMCPSKRKNEPMIFKMVSIVIVKAGRFIFPLFLSVDSFVRLPRLTTPTLTPFPLTSHTMLVIGISQLVQ